MRLAAVFMVGLFATCLWIVLGSFWFVLIS